MVDAMKYAESMYVTIACVHNSPSKRAVILGSGQEKEDERGKKRLELPIEIDGKQKIWTPNQTQLTSMISAFGAETGNWIGKSVSYIPLKMNGRDTFVCQPVIPQKN